MKIRKVKVMLVLFAWTHCCCLSSPVEQLKLWMTYEEVAALLPSKTTLVGNPTANDYRLTSKDRKLTAFYYLDLEDNYKVSLTFNADKELVLINRIERATEIPKRVLQRMKSPDELERHAARFRVGPGEGRIEAWEAMAGQLEEKILEIPKGERVPAIRKLLGMPDGVHVSGYRPEQSPPAQPDKVVVKDPEKLTYILKTDDLGHMLLNIESNQPADLDFGNVENIPFLPVGISKEEGDVAQQLGANLINLGCGRLDGDAKEGFSLNLSAERLDVATLSKVASLKALAKLTVTGTKFDDASLRIFKGHNYLASITLRNTAITVDGLAVLDSLPELKWVTIHSSTFSHDETLAIRKAVPRCSFEFKK